MSHHILLWFQDATLCKPLLYSDQKLDNYRYPKKSHWVKCDCIRTLKKKVIKAPSYLKSKISDSIARDTWYFVGSWEIWSMMKTINIYVKTTDVRENEESWEGSVHFGDKIYETTEAYFARERIIIANLRRDGKIKHQIIEVMPILHVKM